MIASVKSLLKKSADAGNDFYEGLLILRSTPLVCGLSPAELMMGRKIRANLPVSNALLQHNVKNFDRDFSKEKKKYKKYYDRTSRPLPALTCGTKVLLYNFDNKLWDVKGTVVEQKGIRSYLVKTEEGVVYRRNRVHIKPRSFRRYAAVT